jgi:c-di-GMP-binding flagellar brake protein YcgR
MLVYIERRYALMANQRQYIRIKSDSHCVVMDEEGCDYDAMLQDISLGGALIKVKDGIPESLEVGDICKLMLCLNVDSCSIRHSCRIVRHDSVSMGVQFLTDTFH